MGSLKLKVCYRFRTEIKIKQDLKIEKYPLHVCINFSIMGVRSIFIKTFTVTVYYAFLL